MVETKFKDEVEEFLERRREGRERAYGSVIIDEQSYQLLDWSSSGFLVEGFGGGLSKGDRVKIEFEVRIDDETYFFNCGAIIVRADAETGHLAGAFVDMTEEDRLAVAQYFE